MGKALYRKYRSRNLSEVIGQDHITATLSNALKNNQISHAYLLTGPRGVGKTSIARILAHEINKLPYEEENQHLDIIEIDAASNRRIDEIRDLREKSRLAPTSAKYKVYIIDEVHMLTKEAFNALLKTLEEPPAHVVFILATTELHKLPATIISRTQRFAFRPINTPDMIKHLRDISNKEKISITDEALELIAEHAGGGFRDAISLLDQIKSAADKITIKEVEEILGRPSATLIQALLEYITSHNVKSIYEQLKKLYEAGYSPAIITDALLNEGQKYLRKQFDSGILTLLDELLRVEISVNKNIALEIALIKIAQNGTAENTPEKKSQKHTPIQKEPLKIVKQPLEKTVLKKEIKEEVGHPDAAIAPKTFEDFDAKWQDILASIKKTHNTLYGVLNNAGAQYSDAEGSVILSFRFPFHLKKVSEAKNQEIIKDAIFKETGSPYGLILNKQEKEPKPVKKTVSASKSSGDTMVSSVINVFGGGEVIK